MRSLNPTAFNKQYEWKSSEDHSNLHIFLRIFFKIANSLRRIIDGDGFCDEFAYIDLFVVNQVNGLFKFSGAVSGTE